HFANLHDDAGRLIDQVLVLYFPAPRSFTGEDVIEIHCHGAPAVIRKIFDFLATQNMRMATPGEFSRRAFDNNKMDLADVDGLAALLDAQTERQRQMALKSMTGGDGRVYDAWRTQMIEIAAYSAAILDYADDDLPPNIANTVRDRTQKLYDEIQSALSRYAAVRAVRGGFNIALVGNPNVGKSSLFNRMVGTARAIVSDVPGTTRDVVTANLDIDGYMVNLSDTAGLRDTNDTVERIGIERTYNEMENADLVLRVVTADDVPDTIADNEILVINKSDLNECHPHSNAICISAHTGDGMDTLMTQIRTRMHTLMDGAESQLVVNARTHALLTDALDALGAAIRAGDNFDIMAENVRMASVAIGKILGVISAADVMDATFGQLCLGK
ncbi:MAG: tRNA uridine-5-carboxymethylaminomethyl(34) synthesis GTPase MnmE, partial [Alphaproteobacteria bacterium]|nr:tRNA uridine-5-carboxymethylaminomethyl(34) synthesis GTPase MnmE [Alphaproteobacteria bacterium]